jgi:hypothetical protein
MSMVKLSKIGVAVLSPKTYTFANSPLSAAHGTAQAGGGTRKDRTIRISHSPERGRMVFCGGGRVSILLAKFLEVKCIW